MAQMISLDKQVKLLSMYAGRDKVIRTAYFTLVLWSTKMDPEKAKIILGLAKQLSQTRLVLRQLNHPSMFQASRDLIQDAKTCADPVDHSLNSVITGAYTIYGFCEVIAWLADAGVITANAAKWFNYCLYLWIVALFAGIVKSLRSIVLKTLRRKDSSIDRLTLIGLSSDFISAINSLPFKFLWSGRLSKRTTATFSLIASAIGVYRLL